MTNSVPRPVRVPTRLPDHDAQRFSLVATWRSIRKYWVISLATLLTVALGVTFYTLGQKKIYQAAGTIMFDPNPPRPLGKDFQSVVDMSAGGFWTNQEFYTTQYKVMQSMRVALAVTEQLNLQNDAAFVAQAPPGSLVHPLTAPLPLELAAQMIQGHLAVEPVRESRLATLKYEDADPARARRILTTIMDTYVEQNLQDATATTGSAVEWLRGQLDKLKNDLEHSEMSLHEYKLNKNILSVQFDDQSNMLREEIKQVNEVLTGVRTKREESAARRNELVKVEGDPDHLPASELLQSPVLAETRAKYQEAVRDRDSFLGEGKGVQHPDVQSAQRRVDAGRAALMAEIANIQGAVERDLAILNGQETGLAKLYERANRQALDLNLLEIEYNRLKRSKENNEKLYQMILERTKESDIEMMLRVNNVRILERPLMPGAPVRPRVGLNVGVGTFFGALLGIAAAFTLGLLDRTLKTPDDVERELGLSFLGLLPSIDESSSSKKLRRRARRGGSKLPQSSTREFVVHQFPMSGVAEAARAIRTNLMFTAPDHPFKTLLVTSGGPSEGKTTVACCIAIAMAQAGQKVLVVDCDLRRPRMHRIFGKNPELGVTTALLADFELDGQVLKTEILNLDVLPAGPIPPNPSETLQSERFKALIAKLGERYDRVIIDSPPIIAVTDAAILSTIVDGTIVVTKAFHTGKELARQAVRALLDVNASIAGVILNSVDLDRHEYKYYYHYYNYKKNGYYGSDLDTPSKGSQARAANPN